MEVSEIVGGTGGGGVAKVSSAISENAHEVKIEKTATGSIEQESSMKRSVEQSIEKSVQQQQQQQISSQSVQKSVQQQSVMVSSTTTTQRKVATSVQSSSSIRIGQSSTEIEEIEF